ncbi:hypothetical protein [Clostridium paraputrificum]|uniref:hypothetical protein n=1 Tax=Clostridium paraputrificum TaxID=29363 RepID=UPI001B3C8F1F|nr:hypothetical protein [Clostridium paraputrificum]
MNNKVIQIQTDETTYYPVTVSTAVYRTNKTTPIEESLSKIEENIGKVVAKYNESYPLPVEFVKNAWAIWDGSSQSGVAYVNNETSGKRFSNPRFFYVDRPTTINFTGGDAYQFCTMTASNASGANAKWGKEYISGNSYVLDKGFHLVIIKKMSGSQEQVMDEYDYKNFTFTLTPSTI